MKSQKISKFIFRHKVIIGFLIVILSLVFLYRDVFLQGKILFPSNFLAQAYSPWSTQRFQGWENGIPHKPIGGNDQIRFFYPSRSFTNESLSEGSFPLWNPYIFSGNPHIADFQSAVFYPLNIIYFLLPQIAAWSILVFIQPILAMFFTYIYIRSINLEKSAAFLGALAFGFSGFVLAWSQENAVVTQACLWLPLALFGIEKFVKTNSGWYLIIIALSLSTSFLAGFFQITFYIFVFTFFYSLIRVKNPKVLFLLLTTFIFSLCLSGIQLIPSIEAFLQSPRTTSSASYIFSQYLLPITHIANALAPDVFGNPGSYNFFGRAFYHETVIYIGVIPLIFALVAFIKPKTLINKFYIFVSIISFLLTINFFFTKWFFSIPLPLISTFVPSRMLFITTFSLAILSAFGFSKWLKSREENKINLNLIIYALIFVLILISLYGFSLLFLSYDFRSINDFIIRQESHITESNVKVMLRNLVLPFIMIFLTFTFTRFGPKKIIVLAFITITFLGQFYFLNKYFVVGFPQFLYPEHPVISLLQNTNSFYRSLTLGEPILSNISLEKHIYSPEGLDPIYSNRYGQLLFASENDGKLTNNIPRIEANLSDFVPEEKIDDNSRRLRLLSLLGVKYIAYFESSARIPVEEKFPPDSFIPVFKNQNWYIFEYKDVLPRAFVAGNIIVENQSQKILNFIFDPGFNLSENIILEEQPVSLTKDNFGDVAKITMYEPQKVEIETKTEKNGMLFLSDTYYPGWEAYVDEKPTKIYRANFSFRAIELPEGKHKIEFVYKPRSFTMGASLSFISAIIVLVFIFRLLRPKVSRNKNK